MTDETRQSLYRVVCPDLTNVVLFKVLNLDEEKKLYTTIRRKIRDAQQEVNVYDYKVFLVDQLIADERVLELALSENDALEEDEVIDSLYEAIVALYPNFALSFICSDLNSSAFLKGIGDESALDRLKRALGEGEEEDEQDISLSSLDEILAAESDFKQNIVGQRDAIEAIVKSLKLAATGMSSATSMLFVGPTGVGKTELAKLVGERYSGNFYKINCAEYAGGHEYAKLIGSPPGYIGHTEKSLMAEKAEKSNRWVFLFDEIEKAHHKLYDFLLSLLDDGTCTDNLGNVLDFSESLFIFTSNKGVVDSKRRSVGFGNSEPTEEEQSKRLAQAVKGHFAPEFINRIDEIVQFSHLSKQDIRRIARLQLEKVPIEITEPLVNYVVDNGYSKEYGARNLQRFIKNNISVKIADAILHKKVPTKSVFYTPRVTKDGIKIVGTKKFSETEA